MNRPDATDLAIINLLQKDARQTVKQIAEQLNLSTTPVFERIKWLEKNEYLKKYVALANRSKLGFELVAFCNVSLKEHSLPYLNLFETEIRKLNEVIECYHIAGMYDYLLKVIVPNMEAYHNFITHKLAVFENIGNVQSSFVMTEVKLTTALPIQSI